MQLLQKWLSCTFGQKFKYKGNSLVHGIQHDWHSCGIVLSNTIAHTVKGTPLWEQHQYILEWIGWFLCLASRAEHPDPNSATIANTNDEHIMELDDEASVLLAIGDHNFPDLQQFALATNIEDKSLKESVEIEQISAPLCLSLNDLLNPASNEDEAGVPDYEEMESDDTSAFGYDVLSYTNMSEGYCHWGSSGPASEPQTDSEGLSAGGTMDVDDVNDDEDCFCVNTPTASSEDGMDVSTDTSALSKLMSLRDVFLPRRTETKERNGTIPFKVPQPTKCPRARVESDSSNQSDSSGYCRRSKVAKGEGKSWSGVAAQARQEKLKRGELELKQKELETWKNKLLANDPKVEFHPTDPHHVHHSTCGSKVTMKYVCDAT
jgi:hypothetical protein